VLIEKLFSIKLLFVIIVMATGGEPGTEVKTCPTCNGKGKIHETKNSFLGQFTTVRTCSTCNGNGKVPTQKCKKCHGTGVVKNKKKLLFKFRPALIMAKSFV
jgi:DnaJ-class molecular chaperone